MEYAFINNSLFTRHNNPNEPISKNVSTSFNGSFNNSNIGKPIELCLDTIDTNSLEDVVGELPV